MHFEPDGTEQNEDVIPLIAAVVMSAFAGAVAFGLASLVRLVIHFDPRGCDLAAFVGFTLTFYVVRRFQESHT